MKIKTTCPLGHECEKAVDNTIERCAWYIEVAGKHPQTGEDINEFQCSLTWLPTLLIENARTNRGQTAAIESLRNEQVIGQQQFLRLMQQAASNN